MNSELDTIFEQLKSRSTRQVLDDLARVSATLAKHDRARPEVELQLTSGPIVRGRLVSLSDHGQGVTILLHTGGTAVAFVRVDQVAAVTVADASLLVKPVMSDAPVPSKLELQRQCAARADGLSASLGHAVTLELGGASELDDDGRRAIGIALPLVQEVLHAVASDAMGKEALAKIATIELGATDKLEVTVDRRRLTIRAPKLLSEQPDHAALRKAIEKLF